MHLPIGPDPIADTRSEISGHSPFFQAGQILSLESQLRLRGLYDYIDTSRIALDEIRKDLSLFISNAEDTAGLRNVSEQLAAVCIEAEGWGFDALYRVGMSLQVLLLDYGHRIQEEVFWNTLTRGVSMMSSLLDQCENEFRSRLAVGDFLDSVNQLSHY
jgi:hypothetical protein